MNQNCLIELRRGSQARPGLFFLSDFTGDLSALYPLIAALDEDFACFGLQPRLRGDDDPALWSRQWVQRYGEAVLDQQAKGPYLFLGYSLGGALALEVANWLLERGDGPVAVALIDSRPTGSRHERVVAHDLPLLRLLRETTETTGSALGPVLALLGNLERAERRGEVPRGLNVLAMLQQLAAGEGISAREYSFPVLLLRAETPLPSDVPADDEAFGWTEFCRGAFEVRLAPGDHTTMLSHPHVRVVADRLEDWLRQLETQGRAIQRPGNVEAFVRGPEFTAEG
jgi:thioesterase domain-containing protein